MCRYFVVRNVLMSSLCRAEYKCGEQLNVNECVDVKVRNEVLAGINYVFNIPVYILLILEQPIPLCL